LSLLASAPPTVSFDSAIAVIEVFRIRDSVKSVINVAGVLAEKSLVEVDEAGRVLHGQRPPHDRVEQ